MAAVEHQVRSPFTTGYEAGRQCARRYWMRGVVVGSLVTIGVLAALFWLGTLTVPATAI